MATSSPTLFRKSFFWGWSASKIEADPSPSSRASKIARYLFCKNHLLKKTAKFGAMNGSCQDPWEPMGGMEAGGWKLPAASPTASQTTLVVPWNPTLGSTTMASTPSFAILLTILVVLAAISVIPFSWSLIYRGAHLSILLTDHFPPQSETILLVVYIHVEKI